PGRSSSSRRRHKRRRGWSRHQRGPATLLGRADALHDRGFVWLQQVRALEDAERLRASVLADQLIALREVRVDQIERIIAARITGICRLHTTQLRHRALEVAMVERGPAVERCER